MKKKIKTTIPKAITDRHLEELQEPMWQSGKGDRLEDEGFLAWSIRRSKEMGWLLYNLIKKQNT